MAKASDRPAAAALLAANKLLILQGTGPGSLRTVLLDTLVPPGAPIYCTPGGSGNAISLVAPTGVRINTTGPQRLSFIAQAGVNAGGATAAHAGFNGGAQTQILLPNGKPIPSFTWVKDNPVVLVYRPAQAGPPAVSAAWILEAPAYQQQQSAMLVRQSSGDGRAIVFDLVHPASKLTVSGDDIVFEGQVTGGDLLIAGATVTVRDTDGTVIWGPVALRDLDGSTLPPVRRWLTKDVIRFRRQKTGEPLPSNACLVGVETRLATTAEAIAGTDDGRGVTPVGAHAAAANEVGKGREVITLVVFSDANANVPILRPKSPNTVMSGDGSAYTFRVKLTADTVAGGFSPVVQHYDGSSFIPSTAMFTAAGATVGGIVKKGHLVEFDRILPSYQYQMADRPDLVSRALTRLALETGEQGKLPSPDRPLAFGRLDGNQYLAKMLPNAGQYLNGAKRRHTDQVQIDFFNMGEFQNDPGGVMAFQGFRSRFGKDKFEEHCNFRFGEIDGGLSTDVGLPPSTFESVPMGGNWLSDPDPALGHFPAAGVGHGFQMNTSWRAVLMRQDATTGHITAATRGAQLTVTIPGHGYSVGRKVTFSGVTGMTQLNGLTLPVTNVAGDVLTFAGTNSTAFGIFTGHTEFAERDIDVTALTNGDFRYGDRLTVTNTGLLHDDAGNPWCGYLYRVTADPAAAQPILFETEFNPDDPAVLITPAVQRAVMHPLPGRGFDQVQVYAGEILQPTIYPIDKRDGSATVLPMSHKFLLSSSSNPRRRVLAENLGGYSMSGGSPVYYSHWEDTGGGRVWIEMIAPPYISNNAWGPKLNSGQAFNTTKRNIDGVKFGATYAITVLEDGAF